MRTVHAPDVAAKRYVADTMLATIAQNARDRVIIRSAEVETLIATAMMLQDYGYLDRLGIIIVDGVPPTVGSLLAPVPAW